MSYGRNGDKLCLLIRVGPERCASCTPGKPGKRIVDLSDARILDERNCCVEFSPLWVSKMLIEEIPETSIIGRLDGKLGQT